MRHLYAFLFLLSFWLLPGRSHAQLSGADSLRQRLTSIFAPLDKSQVPTAYLEEYGVRLLPLRLFSGTALTDTNRTDMATLRYLRTTLASARVAGTDTLPDVPALNARLSAASASGGGAIPLVVQYMPYASIRPDALQNNLLRVQNGQVVDVPGRSQSPYRTNVLFAAAPSRRDAPTGSVAFVFRRNLYLSGNGAVPFSIDLDFGDGRGYQAATWGQPLRTTYSSAGTKQVKVRLTYIIGSFRREVRESWFDFTVQSVATASRYASANDLEYIVPITSAHASAHVSVRYGAGHTSLVKPLIVVEQYNLASVADGKLEHCNNPNNDIKGFLEKIGPLANNFDFDNHLEQAGYDLVYIDLDYNTDDIRRNAALFEDVVRWVNDRKQPLGGVRQPNVVLAMSMGGLIARYGLAEMTKLPPATSGGRNLNDPETRLLALHDSPQRGAYNPIGVQSLTRSFDVPFLFNLKVRDLKDELGAAVEVLNQPATQQLSILNAFNGRGGSGIQANTFLNGSNSPYRQMIDNVPGAAYTIVATSDGSQCGQPQNTPLGVLLSSTSLNRFLPPVVLPFIGGFTLQTNMAAYGLPAYGTQAEVSHARIWIQYDLCIGTRYFGFCFPIKFYLLNESATSPANTLPYETLPGGNTNYKRESGTCADLGAITSFFLNVTLYDGDVCFVPTFSALDLPTTTPATAYAKYTNGLTDNPTQRVGSPGISRFIAQEQSGSQFSLTHLRYTARNSEWLFDQMENLPLASNFCSTECNNITATITGPAQLCPGATGTYTINNLPAGVQVRWSVSTSGVVTPGSGTGNSFTVQALAGADGTTTIQATLVSTAGGCELPLTELPVRVGSSQVGIGIYGGCGGLPATFTADGLNIGTNFRWTIDGRAQPQYDDQAQITYTLSNTAASTQVAVTVAGTCPGAGTQAATYNVVIEHGAGCANELTAPQPAQPTASIYPNPAHESLYVHLENVDTARPTTVRLFDGQGRLALEQSSKGDATIKVKVNKLPPGLYFVHVLRGSEVLTRQQLQLE